MCRRLLTGGQLVVNEIHVPDMIEMGRLRTVDPQLRLDATLGNLLPSWRSISL